MFSQQVKTVFVLSVFMFVWWVYIVASGLVDSHINYFYGVGLGILPIISALFGFLNGSKWGGSKSAMGRALYFLSAGLLTWGIGTLVFAYYNIMLKVAVPYPSVADIFYIISWPLWTLGMVSLSKATGVRFQFSNLVGRLTLFIIPVVAIVISYYLLVVVARGGVITIIDDPIGTLVGLAYVIGDVVILTFALLVYGLSFNYLGGYYRWPIIILLSSFVVNYVADFFFALTVTNGTYFVANWVDLVFTIAFVLFGLATTMIDPTHASVMKNSGSNQSELKNEHS